MRTHVYVDGYNLYYGRLQGTPYKWLDIASLCRLLAERQDPASNVTRVLYFTSPVLARLATHGDESVRSQNSYLRALAAMGVEIVLGRHQLAHGFAPRYDAGVQPSRKESVPIWQLDEKETDTRIALSLYRDTLRLQPQQVVLISGDTDHVPVLEALREDFHLSIGLVLPRRPDGARPPPRAMPALADWTLANIPDADLSRCQLPYRVSTGRTPACKPVYW